MHSLDHLAGGREERFLAVVLLGAFGGGLARVSLRQWKSLAHSRRPSGPTHRGSRTR
jgi:hypothetical protein